MQETKSTCCYCGVGCGVIITSTGKNIVDVRGDPNHPANFGRLCTKGSTLHLSVRPEARLAYPEVRHSRTEARQRMSWDQTLDLVADKFSNIIKQFGPDSVGFYISGQLLTEDYYVFNKLAKGLIGTNNVDTNSRLCMSSAVAGYKATLGADAPPACYADIDFTDCLFIAGSNTAFAHPIIFRRIEDARSKNPDLKIIVVDPRNTDTAAAADLHLAILPGTDVALFNGMLHVMLWENLCDLNYIERSTEGFAKLKETLQEYTPQSVAAICGVPKEEIIQAAKWFALSKATLSMYCQGLNQSTQGTEKNAALINLHLATAQIGKPGAGPFSLTGQPNAMGGREVGGMANLLSAHRDLSNPQHRAEIANLWGVASVPDKPGKTAVEMFEAVHKGEIKALWIACTNPAQSMPHQNLIREALTKAEFVVLQEAFYQTDTAQYADVLLPATTWGEKAGTVTNSERRISRVRSAVEPVGEARDDWEIIVDFAQKLGKKLNSPHVEKLFSYQNPEHIFNEHRETTRGCDLDITGLSYELIETKGPQQWPFPEGATQGKERLYEDGVFPTENGRAKFFNTTFKPVAENTDARFPLHLMTGRLRDQWHGMSRTGTVAQLFNHVEEPLVAMHAEDMRRRGLKNGDIVKIKSRRGELVIQVEVSDQVRPTQIFIPMHWGEQFMSGKGANVLMPSNFDPFSKQPELKHAAVEVEKLPYKWQMIAMRSGNEVKNMMEVQPLLSKFEYATCGLYGREEPLLLVQIAGEKSISPDLIAQIDVALGMEDETKTMTYRDVKRGISKRIFFEEDRIKGVRLTGETAAKNWLKEIMVQGGIVDEIRPWVLAPISTPPAGKKTRGKIICSCFDVSELEIQAQLKEGKSFTELQGKLKCGTKCGSCTPELKRMAQTGRNMVGVI